MHDVDTLLGALPEGLPPGLTMEFRGNGVGFVILETALRDTPAAAQIKFGPNLPEAEWVAAMKAADVALVTMRPDAAGLVMPSKTYSALVAGQAVLAVCPADSDLAELIRQHDCGWVVSPGDCAGLAGLLRRLAGSPAEVLACRRRAWQAGHEHYDQRVLAGEWSKLLDTVSSVR
jgi:glycosyltransferase involved in cell wall biosynthesis